MSRPLPAVVIDALQNDHIEIKNRHAEILGAPIGATEQDIIDGLNQLSHGKVFSISSAV